MPAIFPLADAACFSSAATILLSILVSPFFTITLFLFDIFFIAMMF